MECKHLEEDIVKDYKVDFVDDGKTLGLFERPVCGECGEFFGSWEVDEKTLLTILDFSDLTPRNFWQVNKMLELRNFRTPETGDPLRVSPEDWRKSERWDARQSRGTKEKKNELCLLYSFNR